MGTRNVVRTTVLSTLLLPLLAVALLAQDLLLAPSVTVGASPAQIVANEDRGEIHILHAGVDKNFNGIVELDSGDVAASWYKLDRTGQVIDSLDFGLFFNSYPVRAAFDFEEGTLYAPIGGGVASYDTETMRVIDPNHIEVPAAALTWDPNSTLLILSVRAPDFTSPGELLLYEPDLAIEFGSIAAGVNPADGITGVVDQELGLERLFVMNEGGGANDASLTMFGLADDIYGAVNGSSIGGGSDRAVVDGNEAFVLLSSADRVRVIDRKSHEEKSNSPIVLDDTLQALDIAVGTDYIAILALEGNLLIYNRDNYSLVERRGVPKSARTIAVVDDRVYVVGPYKPKSAPTTSVTVVEVDGATSEFVTPDAPAGIWRVDDSQILVVGDSGPNGWWQVMRVADGAVVTSGTIPFEMTDRPERMAFDPARTLLGVTDGTRLIEIDVTEEGTGDTIWRSDELFVDRLVAGDGIWLMANYPGDFAPEPGYLLGVDMETGLERTSVVLSISIPLLPIPAVSQVEGAGAFYAIPLAPFGGPDADLTYVEYHSNLFEGTLGSFANHITRGAPEYCPEEFYTMVTMSGSHEVVYLNGLETIPQISSRTPTGTSGFDGPRASSLAPCVPIIFCGATLTTTYGGELILHFDGNVLDRQELEGRGEGIALLGDTAWAANVLETGSFSEPGMTVTPATVKWPPGSVAENMLPEQSLSVRHDRSAGELSIRLELESVGAVTIRLIDMNGRPILTPEKSIAGSGVQTTHLTTRGLPTGAYLLTVETPDGSAVRMVEVVR